MSSILLGLVLLAVGWLVIWTGKDHSRPSKTWWPFAMRDEAKLTAKEEPSWANRRRGGVAGKPVQRPWRRSGF